MTVLRSGAAWAEVARVALIMEVAATAPPRGRIRRFAREFNLAPSLSWVTRDATHACVKRQVETVLGKERLKLYKSGRG
ncbi:hypothetical protein GCM10017600_64260 [Streptosporangium carneum]|uniref:Uncharacterized protein n=1 Tax=Streptosporangium carneum TaxID=47481 RepID=A0A9W6MGC2_9ACTN|nr:hypothetical protein GCM10017600_64260 [Streptosporangium carneum]